MYHVKGEIEVKDLEYKLDTGVHLLDEVSFHLKPGEQMALVGFSGSGKSTLAMVLAQLYRYDRGHVLLDGHELRQLTKMDVSCNIGFVAQHPFIFNGTIRDNILYGSRALLLAEGEGGKRTLPSAEKVLEMLRTVGVAEDVARLGLNTIIPRERCEPLVPDFIRMRHTIFNTFGEKLAEAVEFYDVHNFLQCASIYENLLFSDVFTTPYLPENIPYNRTFLKFLANAELARPLLQLGRDLARQIASLLTDMGENGGLFSADIPIKPEQIETYKTIVKHLNLGRSRVLGKKEKALLLHLALEFVPAQHTIVTIPVALQEKIVQARHRFIREIVGVEIAVCSGSLDIPELNQAEHADFSPYCFAKYQYSHTLRENLIYGKLKADQTASMAELVEKIRQLMMKEHYSDKVMDAGLDFEVGSKGDRLSGGQQQKIALARALLKDPPILILDEATASLDNASQAHIQRFIETQLKGKTTVVAVMHRLDLVPSYDKVLVMRTGRVVESGSYQQLMEQKGVLYKLVQGN